MVAKVEGSGRVKGTPNRPTKLIWQLLEQRNFDPLVEMINMATDRALDPEIRAKCVRELARYVYPQRKAQMLPVEFTVDEANQANTARDILKRVAAGEITPDAGVLLLNTIDRIGHVVESMEMQDALNEWKASRPDAKK